MNEVKALIAKEALVSLAGHYKTTVANVSKEVANGNMKLKGELISLCEKSLELLYKEVA